MERPTIAMRPAWITPTAIAVPAGIIINIPGYPASPGAWPDATARP